MTYTATITAAAATMSNLSISTGGSEVIGKFKKRDLAKSAVKMSALTSGPTSRDENIVLTQR